MDRFQQQGLLFGDETRDSTKAELDQLIASGALFVANHSGGKDSQVQLIRLLERVPASQLVVVHASLGPMEWPGAMELARDQAAAAGLPFHCCHSLEDAAGNGRASVRDSPRGTELAICVYSPMHERLETRTHPT